MCIQGWVQNKVMKKSENESVGKCNLKKLGVRILISEKVKFVCILGGGGLSGSDGGACDS